MNTEIRWRTVIAQCLIQTPPRPKKTKSAATGVKKVPHRLPEESWKAIELSVCVGGLTFTEVARRFNVDVHAVMMRAKRGRWLRSAKISQSLQDGYMDRETTRRCNDEAAEIIGESWAEKGEAHRGLVYGMTNAALKKVAKNPPPLESWSDIERADKAGRRACGLDHETHSINIGMELVNYRLEHLIHLPKDALPKDDGAPQDPPRVAHGQDVTDARL